MTLRLQDPDPDRCTAGQIKYPERCTWHPDHHWCEVCQGWYGVHHDGIHEGPGMHPRGYWEATQCACRPCKTYAARAILRATGYGQTGQAT